MAMEAYFTFSTPEQANGPTGTDAPHAGMPVQGNACKEAPSSAAPSNGVAEGPEDATTSSSPDVKTDPRFQLGLETGRRFRGTSGGDIYELLDAIGSGSASTVFKCKRIGTTEGTCHFPRLAEPTEPLPAQSPEESVLAVKAIDLKGLRLNRNFDKELIKLRKEAQYLKTLRHPCIVRFIDYVETSDAIFIVQEYMKGGELFYKIVERGCLSEQQACFIAHQVLAAIVFMHNSGVIHRDIKPENILVHEEVEEGFYRVKLADFGLAKTLANCGALATTMVGTPQYWAPEVINCGSGRATGSYSYEADLWSFGVCLYVFLGGTYPFDEAAGPLQQLVLSGRFHFRHSRFSRVSEDAKDLIRRALVVDQTRRVTEKEIFYHPWMTRWLCGTDRARFSLSDGGTTAFRFMPPLPSLSPPGTSYPPLAWKTNEKKQSTPRQERPGPSHLALDPTRDVPLEDAEMSNKRRSTAEAVELRTDSSPGVAIRAMLPGFVRTNQPIPPFHLPLLLPLQLHLLLSVHLLLLSLRESQPTLLLAQKLQKELWALQRCVHTAVGFFEVTATSAIETVSDIFAVFDETDSGGDLACAAEAVSELFAQVRRWTCEMQKQGERLGAQYERAEASVSQLICCLVAALTNPGCPSSTPDKPQELSKQKDAAGGIDIPLISEASGTSPAEKQPSVAEAPSLDGQERALMSPVSVSHETGNTKDLGFTENGMGVWGGVSSLSSGRMDILREFLGTNLRRMLYSCAQPPREEVSLDGTCTSSEDKKQVDSGVQAWSQVGMPDPSLVTEEILDFLFLSTKTAASHARQMTEQKKPGECFSVRGPDATSGCASPHESILNSHEETADIPREVSRSESVPSSLKGSSKSSVQGGEAVEGSERGGTGEKSAESTPQCVELSFLCEPGSFAGSSNAALQEKIALSRIHLKSLEKLRQLSYILTCVCSFWSNFDVILCRLLQLQQITETLTKHARAAWINKRAQKRLEHLKDCWIKFRTQCRIYLELSNARNAKLMDLGLHVQMRADQLDAIRALREMPDM